MRDRAEHVCICYVFLLQIGGGGYIGLQLETAICRDWLTGDNIRPTPNAESNSWTKLMLKVCAINSLERLLLSDFLNADNDSRTVMTALCSSNKLKAVFSRQRLRGKRHHNLHIPWIKENIWNEKTDPRDLKFFFFSTESRFSQKGMKSFFFYLQRQDMKLGTSLTAWRLFRVHHTGVFHLNPPASNPDLRLDFRAIYMCSHVLKKTI